MLLVSKKDWRVARKSQQRLSYETCYDESKCRTWLIHLCGLSEAVKVIRSYHIFQVSDCRKAPIVIRLDKKRVEDTLSLSPEKVILDL